MTTPEWVYRISAVWGVLAFFRTFVLQSAIDDLRKQLRSKQ